MTAARAAATPSAKPAARVARGRESPAAAPQSAGPDAAAPLRPRTACACGGGCPRCSGRARAEPASNASEREAEVIGARILHWPRPPGTLASAGASRAQPDAAGATAAAAAQAPAVARSARPAVGATTPSSTAHPARGPPPPRRRVAATAGPHGLGGGKALGVAERERFELPLGRDLAAVRVHDGPPAAAAAAERHAHAYAYGSHVVLGRAAQRAPDSIRLAVLAHELVHVAQQSGAAAANDDRYDHQARAPPQLQSIPILHVAPLGVMCLGDDDSIIPQWASDAAGAVAEAGEGAFDTAADAAGRAGEFALDTAAVVIDELAPGLLPFLRGGALGQLTELFCGGIDTLLGSLFSSLGEIDFMSAIETTFSALAEGVRKVETDLGKAASSAIGAVLGPLVGALKEWGPPIVDTLQSVASAVNDLFGSVWDNLAVPALGILETMGGAALRGFNDLAAWVWNLVEPIRTGAETAWNWLQETFDLAWDSSSGVRDWLGEMASSAWDAFLETIEPVRGPLETAAGVALVLSPVGPIILLTEVLPPLWEKLTWVWDNWNSEDILVSAQETLRDDVLPAIIGTVSGVAGAIADAASWLAETVSAFGDAMGGVLDAFGANSCLTAVTNYLNHVADQYQRLAAWAEDGFAGLSDALQAVFDALTAIFQPILDFLVRLLIVALNPPMLPIAIAGAIWLLCPDGLKPPVIDFVLGLLIAFIDGSTLFLAPLGPMAFVLQAGTLGFLRELRGGGDIDEKHRIAASNKIANLAAGGGPAFILGFSLGFLHGVIDGVIDPFRLIFLIGRVLVAGAQAISRALEPFILATLPGAAETVAGIRGLPMAPATGPPEAAAAAPAPASPVGAGGEEVVAAPADAGVAAEGAGAEVPVLEALPGDAADAEVAAALGPGTAAEISLAAAEPAVDDAALATEMRGEMETEGTTVGGLARLLGDAWQWVMRGAEGLGRAAANAFVEFILQPDFQLGRKLGFVSGFIALQLLIMYLSAGSYSALKALDPVWRELLKVFLRFLDLGGEILGLVGRALRPLRGPFLRGLGAARGFLGRFRFARGLIERVERLAATLFRFGDEAAAASRGTREAAEETAERVSREAVEEVGDRAAREAAEEGGERAAREAVVVEAGERGTREAAEESAERSAREAAEEAAERGSREAAEEGAERGGREAAEEGGERGAREAAEMPAALAAAAAISAANDALDTPAPLLRVQLLGLRAQFSWIRDFEIEPIGPGEYAVWLRASRRLAYRPYKVLVSGDFTSKLGRPGPGRSELDVGKHLGAGWEPQAGFLHGQPLTGGRRPRMSTFPDWYWYHAPPLNIAAEVKNYDLAMNYERMIAEIINQAGGRVISLPGHAAATRWLFIELRGQRVGDLAQLARRIHADLGHGSIYSQLHFILDSGVVRAI